MIPEEIPAGSQLMEVKALPSVPENQRFFFLGLVWPEEKTLDSSSSRVRPPRELLDDTVDWVTRILKPDWVASDLRERLIAARGSSNGQDAFLTRYAVGQNKIQIIVTKFHVHVVIAPMRGVPSAGVLALLHEYLQVDRPDDKLPWTGQPWETGTADGFTFGYQPRSIVRDWREGVYYLTKGRAVKFSLKKIPSRPPESGPAKTGFAPSAEAERNWFEH